MALQTYWHLVKKRLFHRVTMLLIHVLLAAAALFFLAFSIGMPQFFAHGRKGIRNSLAKEIERYGVMTVRGDEALFSQERKTGYFAALTATGEIDGVGMWELITLGGLETKGAGKTTVAGGKKDYWAKLLRIHNANRKAFPDASGGASVQTVMVSYEALGMHRVPLWKGEKDTVYPEEQVQLYLGYAFREIPVGTVFCSGEGEAYMEYVVAGILEKGATLPDGQALLSNRNSFTLDYTVPLDNMLVLRMRRIDGGFFTAANFFLAADGYSYEEAAARLKEVSAAYGLAVETEPLSYRMGQVMGAADWMLAAYGKIGILLGFLSLVILLSAQLLSLLRQKKELGIWLSCGISRRQLFLVLFLENLCKLLFAAGLAMGGFFLIWKILGIRPEEAYRLRYVMYYNINITLVLLAVGMAFLASVGPIKFIETKPLQALVKGDWQENGGGRGRLFCDSPFVAGVFLLSMAASFFTMYYGLGLFLQAREIGAERERAEYGEKYSYRIVFSEEVREKGTLSLPELEYGNLFAECYLPVGAAARKDSRVTVLLLQREELLETVYPVESAGFLTKTADGKADWKSYQSYREALTDREPACISGNKYRGEAYMENGKTYLLIGGVKCRVIGWFADASFEGMDERLLVFADSLTETEKERLVVRGNSVNLLYKRAKKTAKSEKERFLSWVEAVRNQEVNDTYAFRENPKESYDDGGIYESFMPLYQRIFAGMLGFCFLNCAFLAYVWGGLHGYEYMVKRTFGFSRLSLTGEIIGRFFCYEGVAFGLGLLMTALCEALRGRLSFWTAAVTGGFGFVAAVFVTFGILLSLVPVVWIFRANPAEVLKAE